VLSEELHDVLLTMYNSNHHVKEEEMGWACRTYGGEEKYVQSFGEKF